jgi:hypothetical protein
VQDDYPCQNVIDVTGATPPAGTFNVTVSMTPANYAVLTSDPNYTGKVTLLGSH